jgi:pimeloyl-ACP methyl ester carboxylesterase
MVTNGVFLSNEPILLFLHGVGNGDPEDAWKIRLTESLVPLGYPGLDIERVIAPKFAHALKGVDDKMSLPGVTIKPPTRELAKKNRRDFEHRMGAIEFSLGRHDRGNGFPGAEAAINLAVGHAKFEQARNYMENRHIRAQVLRRILDQLPETGKIVIVGHSLGSVIAADLVCRLPVGLEIAGMVTIGSPLASGRFDFGKLRETLKEPPSNLAWWVNFWNEADPVAARRGVSSVIPWMVDFRVDTKKLMRQAHAAEEYLANQAVAEAIGLAMFGSRSREVAKIEKGLDIPLDAVEQFTLLALRYAHLIKTQLKGDIQDRYAGALRRVQATSIEDIRRRNSQENRAMPSGVARLAFDFSDPHAIVPEPCPSNHMAKDMAVVLLTVLAAENIIRPFEITVPRDKLQAAMEDLTAEMGLGSRYGTDVFAAAKLAQEALGGRGVNWIKLGAIGAGAAALIVATGGLALAAGAGLAGAAVITSALASFGPGGMIGGLLTAGTLVGAGGGGIAFGLASPGTTAETLEAVVTRQLSAAILRKEQHLEQDNTLWRTLVETEIEVRREYERLDEFSDDSAPALKELKRKIDAIERALKYLSDNNLEPGVSPGAAD